ncbi:GntR family transcriptional regulator [Glaciibacter psychrotolerans]|uniref:DNA-binding transcriptional regulator YhcF (GntR family) n=1 Tax=Glaciibacter psychrotolerans TaxID=670054 RepID=A0A7Z0EDM7_9MICO|nr:GntR family transcriptional regulator [Leifsonia psychrotolerans]NYJ19695.1 DNA-binding transcriptional regulator YhcF (GntR family) [Leifsonia psychrotolerans]
MNVTIDAHSTIPPFEQLRVQVIELISTGDLVAGTRLPTVRRLAADLALATNTVARAFKELEAAGFIETRGRAGSFVRPQDFPERAALEAAEAYAERIHELGVTREAALGYVEAVLRR